MPRPASPEQRIVILGGGFAGVYLARSLERRMTRAERASIEITLVTSENYLVFQPLLPEVISGTIETLHCIVPLRRLLRRTRIATRSVEAIDLEAREVHLAPGFRPKTRSLAFDHLAVCLGSRLNQSLVPGMREHAIPFKYLGDALRLRNQLVKALEEADLESDPEERQRLLTVVVAGGGFSGVECMAELHSFLLSALPAYPQLRPDEIRCVLLQSGPRILPELSESLASYAQQILSRRGIEIRLNTRLSGVSSDAAVALCRGDDQPQSIPARTVVATVPAAPDPLIEQLNCKMQRGRIEVNGFLQAIDQPCVWAVGDCAAVPQRDGITSPPTAQHAVRQADACAVNLLAELRGQPMRSFQFTGLGKLASLGRGSAVAEVFGFRLRGVVAWLFWRAVYLAKVPGLDRKIRIAVDWTLDCLLPRDITQLRIFEPAGVQHQHFHAGERIFDAGDVGDRLYVMVSGTAEVIRDGACVAHLERDDVFGEIALVSSQPRNARVVAKTDVDLITVPREDFQELVQHLPGVRSTIESIMSSRGFAVPK